MDIRDSLRKIGAAFLSTREVSSKECVYRCIPAGADTGGVDRVDIHPPFFSKKKIRNVTLFEIENKERKKN